MSSKGNITVGRLFELIYKYIELYKEDETHLKSLEQVTNYKVYIPVDLFGVFAGVIRQ